MSSPSFPSSRRTVLAVSAAVMTGAWSLNGFAAEAMLPRPESLADELASALKAGQPLVVMVSLDGCPFCRVARNSYLEPLRRETGVPVVQLDMRKSISVLDFGRANRTHEQLIQAWKVTVAPTVLFFGPNGKEVAERLVGGYIEDFYGAYLDDRLSRARAALKA